MRRKYRSGIDKHATALGYRAYAPHKFARYLKYTFIRNPWDRMISLYEYRHRKYGERNFTWYSLRDGFHDLAKQQLDYLTDGRGKMLVDFIGRFETLYQDFDALARMMRLPRRPSCLPERLNRPYSNRYNSLTKLIVARKFKDDIDRFGYSF